MKIYNRKSGTYEQAEQYGGNLLHILYDAWWGRILMKVVIHPFFSRIYGWYADSFLSKKKIMPFVKKYNISLADYEKQEYKSFNDFFTRRIRPEKRVVDRIEADLVAPADSKLSIYPIEKENTIWVKGVPYTLDELVGEGVDTISYAGGTCLVFRLTVDDYHRYIFVDAGKVLKSYTIKGKLHTVSSISKKHKVYRQNSRVVNVLETRNFGKVLCIEVGALLVGKIRNHEICDFKRGMEKGYFELGGSTIIMILQKDCVKIDADIWEQCANGVEVKLMLGEKIGQRG